LPFQFLRVLGIGAVGRVQLAQQFLRFREKPVAEALLHMEKRLHLRPEICILLVMRHHRRTTDNERRARFINQDRVHFVHDSVIMPPLNLLLLARGHAVVPQIIKPEFRIGSVGNVAVVLLAPNPRRLIMQNAPHGQPEKLIHRAHPLAVARREVIINGHDMDPAAAQGVEIDRQGGHERLPFSGGHFRYPRRMQRITANKLHVKRNHLPLQRVFPHDNLGPTKPPAGILHDGKRLRQNLVQPPRQLFVILNPG